jgi:hypothetical protein
MAPMMGIGWIADHWGMNIAVCTFGVLVIAVGVPVAVLFQRHPRIRPAGHGGSDASKQRPSAAQARR